MVSLLVVICILLSTEIHQVQSDRSQMVIQNLESFVRRGLGYRYVGKLTSGSAGYHRLCLYLNVSRLQDTIQTLRQEIISTTDYFENHGFDWSRAPENRHSPSAVEMMQSEITNKAASGINLGMEQYNQEFKYRMASKRTILLSRLELLDEMTSNFVHFTSNRRSHRQTRQSEGVFPVISEISSLLFGTATARDVHMVNDKFDELANKQNKIISFMNSFASVVNEVQEQLNVAQNNTLQAVTATLVEFRFQILNATIDLTRSMTLSVLRIQNAVEKSIGEVTIHLDKFSFLLQNYLHGFSQTLNGKFPLELINSERLISYLHTIESALPEGIILAISDFKSGSILETVIHTPCHLSSDRDNILLICELELAKIQETYQLYKLFPAPTSVTNLSISQRPMYYVIDQVEQTEGSYMGVTSDGLSYVFISEKEMDNCFHTQQKIICHNHFLERKATSKSSCAYAIYANDDVTEQDLCRRSLMTLPSLFVYPLSDSLYFFATNQNFSVVTLKCPQEDSTMEKRNFDFYHLNVSSSIVVNISRHCAIYSEYFHISEEYTSSSSIEIEIPKLDLKYDSHQVDLNAIFRHSQGELQHIVQHVEEISKMNPKYQTSQSSFKIPIPELKFEAEQLRERKKGYKPTVWYQVINNLSIGFQAIIFLGGFFLVYKVKQIWYTVFPKPIPSAVNIELQSPARE